MLHFDFRRSLAFGVPQTEGSAPISPGSVQVGCGPGGPFTTQRRPELHISLHEEKKKSTTKQQ